jgi:hypothetical protein
VSPRKRPGKGKVRPGKGPRRGAGKGRKPEPAGIVESVETLRLADGTVYRGPVKRPAAPAPREPALEPEPGEGARVRAWWGTGPREGAGRWSPHSATIPVDLAPPAAAREARREARLRAMLARKPFRLPPADCAELAAALAPEVRHYLAFLAAAAESSDAALLAQADARKLAAKRLRAWRTKADRSDPLAREAFDALERVEPGALDVALLGDFWGAVARRLAAEAAEIVERVAMLRAARRPGRPTHSAEYKSVRRIADTLSGFGLPPLSANLRAVVGSLFDGEAHKPGSKVVRNVAESYTRAR